MEGTLFPLKYWGGVGQPASTLWRTILSPGMASARRLLDMRVINGYTRALLHMRAHNESCAQETVSTAACWIATASVPLFTFDMATGTMLAFFIAPWLVWLSLRAPQMLPDDVRVFRERFKCRRGLGGRIWNLDAKEPSKEILINLSRAALDMSDESPIVEDDVYTLTVHAVLMEQ